ARGRPRTLSPRNACRPRGTMPSWPLLIVVVAAAAACGARTELREPPVGDPCGAEGTTRPCRGACGNGVETCTHGIWAGCTAPGARAPADHITLTGTVRDFHDTHPDFENALGDDRGIVAATLGADSKPVYTGHPTTPTTHGREAFDQW